jgi:hypothetical protein
MSNIALMGYGLCPNTSYKIFSCIYVTGLVCQE